MSYQLQITGLGFINSLEGNVAYISQKIGIGTTAPFSSLQVVGTGQVVTIGESSNTAGKQLLFGVNATDGHGEIQSVWQGTGYTALALQPNGGFTGIGTIYPSKTLDVVGTGKFSGQLTLGSTITNGTFTYTLPGATGTLALTTDIPAITANAPLSYVGGVLSISQANTSTNGYLSSTDWNTFNNKQIAGDYITALTGEATATGPGSVAITLSNSAVIGKVLTGLSITGGTIGSTDSILTAFGKVQNQINSLVGGVNYQGTWNASTNTPALTSSVGTKGYYYVVSVAGSTNLNGITDWKIGDWAIYDGTAWQKVDNTDTLTSVGITSSAAALSISNSPLTANGNIGVNFSGTSTQYVAGDGTLVPFPTVVTQAQNLVTEVYNNTGATLTKGTVVYINGGQGNLPTITKAIATGDSTSAQTYGVVRTDITNNNNGYVTVIGNLDNLDTQAYAAGTQLYLSSTTAGAWTDVKQYAPAHLVYVGIVVRSHPTQGVVEIRIQNGFELDELHNVSAQTPSNNQGLFYNSSNSLWENKSIATALGYTPADQSLVVPYTGATSNVNLGIYDLSADRINGNLYTALVNGTIGGSLFLQAGNGSSISYSGTNGIQLNSYDTTNVIISSVTSGTTIRDAKFNLGSITSGSTRTYTLPNADGTLALTSDLDTYVPTSRTLTINGTTYDLSANRSWTISAGISGSGTANQVAFFNGTSSISSNSNLYWDSTNNRLGINNSNPVFSLDVIGNSRISGTLFLTATGSGNALSTTGIANFWSAKINGNSTTGQSYGLQVQAGTNSSDISFSVVNISATELFKITGAGNVGIGTSNPTNTLDVTGTGRFTGALTGASATFSDLITASYGSARIQVTSTTNSANSGLRLSAKDSAGTTKNAGLYYVAGTTTATTFMSFAANDNDYQFNVLANGNVGIGVVPSPSDTYPALQIARAGFMGAGNDVNISSNGYYSSPSWKYIASDTAALYNISGNIHSWYTATSGTASAAISWVERMRITSTGNVGIGTSSPSSLLHIQGSLANLIVADSSSYAAGVGGKITFQGNYRSVGDITDGGYIKINKDNSTNGDYGFNMVFATSQNGGSVSERMRITSGGNVGIGTTSPTGQSSDNRVLQIYGAGTGNRAQLHLVNSNTGEGTSDGSFIGIDSSTNLYINNAESAATIFENGGSERMRITGGGDVGIGAAGGPTSKLDVRGVIGTTYTSNQNVPNNNTDYVVLNALNGGNFNTWMNNVFGCTGYNCLVTIHWDSGNSAGACTFSVTKHGGYNGIGITRTSATTYNGDCFTDGAYIYLRNNGYGAITPSFKVVLLNRN